MKMRRWPLALAVLAFLAAGCDLTQDGSAPDAQSRESLPAPAPGAGLRAGPGPAAGQLLRGTAPSAAAAPADTGRVLFDGSRPLSAATLSGGSLDWGARKPVSYTRLVSYTPDDLTTPPPPAPAAGAAGLLDGTRAARLARDVMNRAIGFTHRCYEYVANAMTASGLFRGPSDANARDRFGYYWPPGVAGHSAYQFAALKNEPSVMKRTGMSTLPVSTRPLPVGTTIVYNRGCMGFSPKHGHIEVVAKSPSNGGARSFYACSDGCTWRTYGWLDAANARSCTTMFIPVRAPR
jgi:hypothetical protein